MVNPEYCDECGYVVSQCECEKPKTNADRIRSMSDEELNKFLWWFKISSMAAFMENGGEGVMNAKEQLEWLNSEDDKYFNRIMSHGE